MQKKNEEKKEVIAPESYNNQMDSHKYFGACMNEEMNKCEKNSKKGTNCYSVAQKICEERFRSK